MLALTSLAPSHHHHSDQSAPLTPHHRPPAQVKSRLVVAPPKYIVKVVDKDGIRTLAEL